MMDRRHLFEVEALKPKSTSATLRRLWGYFGGRRGSLLAVLALALISAWTQVLAPDLIGQTVDCYLIPATQSAASQVGGVMQGAAEAAGSNCSNRRRRVASPMRRCRWRDRPAADRLSVAGAVTTGLHFNLIAGPGCTSGVPALKSSPGHRLSLGYYAKHEAGDIDRMTTTPTRAAGAELRRWSVGPARADRLADVRHVPAQCAVRTDREVTVPFMVLATSGFRSRRAGVPPRRREIGGVNADLQENIAGARAQAFTRRT